MQKFYASVLTDEDQRITLSGLLHSYARQKTDKPQILIVGVSQATAEAYVRDTLRSPDIPDTVLVMDISTVQDKSEYDRFLGIRYVFMLADVAYLDTKHMLRLTKKIAHVLARNTNVKVMLHGSIKTAFFRALFAVWKKSNLRLRTKVDPRFNYVAFTLDELSRHMSGARTTIDDDGPYGSVHVILEKAITHVDPDYLLTSVLGMNGMLRKAETVLVSEEHAWKLFLHDVLARPVQDSDRETDDGDDCDEDI